MNKLELLKSAKPILFNTEMVKAILAGRKKCTRRIIKQRTEEILTSECRKEHPELTDTDFINRLCLAKYNVGDILYVRETWDKDANRYIYRANCSPKVRFLDIVGDEIIKCAWHPSIHMPKEAARIFLKVTDVRAERLQDIITGDYKTPININHEGLIETCSNCSHINGDCKDFISRNTCELIKDFIHIWNSTIKKSDLKKYSWNANPWVWVYDFERIMPT